MAIAPAPLREDELRIEAVRETHCSTVLLTADKAYKMRKPVRFAFVDQSSPAARRRLAEEELRLNQQLAPGVYLGIVDLLASDGHVEPAVEMRRFREADTLATRLATGGASARDLRALGHRLAAFHAGAARIGGGGGASATLARVDRNIEELVALRGPELDPGALERTSRRLTGAVLRHADVLDRRAAAGRWREGHGDLRADHVVVDGRDLLVVDRLEFDRGLRCDDVGSDLAFLLMDLEARDARWAADAVLAAYRDAGGDPGDDALLATWAAYRATVAAKVALLWAAQTRDATVVARARARMQLAGTFLWRSRGPQVLVTCGPPASGKSTLAAQLAERTGFPVLASDRVRKELLGVPVAERAPAGAYASEITLEVYRALGDQARTALARSPGVIVDATMRSRPERAAFRERAGTAPCTWIECCTPAAVADARADARAAAGGAVSDADAAVAQRLRAAWHPLDEVAPADHLMVRMDRTATEAAEEIEARVA